MIIKLYFSLNSFVLFNKVFFFFFYLNSSNQFTLGITLEKSTLLEGNSYKNWS
jgi:hypothetical protein